MQGDLLSLGPLEGWITPIATLGLLIGISLETGSIIAVFLALGVYIMGWLAGRWDEREDDL
jgi:hypothetical protein